MEITYRKMYKTGTVLHMNSRKSESKNKKRDRLAKNIAVLLQLIQFS
jgi:hypothetical protein